MRLCHALWHSPAAASGRERAGLFGPLQHKVNQTTLLLFTRVEYWSRQAGFPNNNTFQEALGIAYGGNTAV